jgi:S-(hydroxymethyl)glutathione dehydrogenase/alcohol dehydrogenase
MPDGTSRFRMKDGTQLFHYMGCSTFANHTVLPEIAVAKVNPDAPFDKICYIGCGVTTGIGAVINTAKVEIGSTAVVFGLGGIGLNVIQGLALAGADMIIGVDLNSDREEWGRKFGMTHFVNAKDVGDDIVAHIVNMTKRGDDQIGGADYTFDCTGNVKVMRNALECSHRGWGVSVVIGVAPAGAEIATRPFQLVTGRTWKGTAFGGARTWRSAIRPAAPSPTRCEDCRRRGCRSPAPLTTASARPSIWTTPTATASSSTGTGPAPSGPGIRRDASR